MPSSGKQAACWTVQHWCACLSPGAHSGSEGIGNPAVGRQTLNVAHHPLQALGASELLRRGEGDDDRDIDDDFDKWCAAD